MQVLYKFILHSLTTINHVMVLFYITGGAMLFQSLVTPGYQRHNLWLYTNVGLKMIAKKSYVYFNRNVRLQFSRVCRSLLNC